MANILEKNMLVECVTQLVEGKASIVKLNDEIREILKGSRGEYSGNKTQKVTKQNRTPISKRKEDNNSKECKQRTPGKSGENKDIK